MRRSAPAEENCPVRDEETAQGQGVECMTKCLSDHGCQNKRKLCLCDGVCGMSCVRPEKECPELPDPPNGQVHLTGRHFQVGVKSAPDRNAIINCRTGQCTPVTGATRLWAWQRWSARLVGSGRVSSQPASILPVGDTLPTTADPLPRLKTQATMDQRNRPSLIWMPNYLINASRALEETGIKDLTMPSVFS